MSIIWKCLILRCLKLFIITFYNSEAGNQIGEIDNIEGEKGSYAAKEYDIEDYVRILKDTKLLNIKQFPHGGYEIISSQPSEEFKMPERLKYTPLRSWKEHYKIWLNM